MIPNTEPFHPLKLSGTVRRVMLLHLEAACFFDGHIPGSQPMDLERMQELCSKVQRGDNQFTARQIGWLDFAASFQIQQLEQLKEAGAAHIWDRAELQSLEIFRERIELLTL
jgi:hypothetical protein